MVKRDWSYILDLWLYAIDGYAFVAILLSLSYASSVSSFNQIKSIGGLTE
jgi:hypothetical protein